MKYGKLTLGKIEAIVNKLGGYDAVEKLLRNELIISEKPKQPKTLNKNIYLKFKRKSDHVALGDFYINKFDIFSPGNLKTEKLFFDLVENSFDELLSNPIDTTEKVSKKKTDRENEMGNYVIHKPYLSPTRIAQEIVYLVRNEVYINEHTTFIWRFQSKDIDYIVCLDIFSNTHRQNETRKRFLCDTLVNAQIPIAGWGGDDPRDILFKENFFE